MVSPDTDTEKLADRAAITAEQLIAAFTLNAPVPERLLYGIYGRRSTFHRWEKEFGLRVRTVPGIGRSIIPSELKSFLMVLRGDASPDVLPKSTRAKVLRQLKAK